jgi:hypothetical protein
MMYYDPFCNSLLVPHHCKEILIDNIRRVQRILWHLFLYHWWEHHLLLALVPFYNIFKSWVFSIVLRKSDVFVPPSKFERS